MKTTTAIVLFFTSLNTSAGPYLDAVKKQEHCKLIGEASREWHQHKTIFGMTLDQLKSERRSGRIPKKMFEDLVVQVISIPRLEEAADENSAYMLAWGACMDDHQ